MADSDKTVDLNEVAKEAYEETRKYRSSSGDSSMIACAIVLSVGLLTIGKGLSDIADALRHKSFYRI